MYLLKKNLTSVTKLFILQYNEHKMANYHFINVSILNQALKPLPGRVWKFLLCSIQKILVDSLHTDYVYFLNKSKPCILHWFCNSWFAFYNSCKIDMQIFLKYKINGSMKKNKKTFVFASWSQIKYSKEKSDFKNEPFQHI